MLKVFVPATNANTNARAITLEPRHMSRFPKNQKGPSLILGNICNKFDQNTCIGIHNVHMVISIFFHLTLTVDL